jgi:hypothetical protein
MPLKLLCSMFHQRFMRYMDYSYCKLFCWYFIEFNDIKFSKCFKLCPLILLTKCFIDFGVRHKNLVMLCYVSITNLILKVFKFLNSGGHQVYLLSCMLIILMKIWHFNTLFSSHQVENVILFIFKLLKLIVYIFGLFQSLN